MISGTVAGVDFRNTGGANPFGEAYEQFPNIKIDTHDDNIPMQHLLAKLGFTCCGHTTLQNGDIRLIYQKAD